MSTPVPAPSFVGDMMYSIDGLTWTLLSSVAASAGDVLTLVDSGGGALVPHMDNTLKGEKSNER